MKRAAEGQQRSIPTYMEYTALSHLFGKSREGEAIPTLEKLAKSLKDEISGKRKTGHKDGA